MLLNAKQWQLHEEWQQIRLWAEVAPRRKSHPSRAENDTLSSQGGKAAEYRAGYPNSHLTLERYLNIADDFLTEPTQHHHSVPVSVPVSTSPALCVYE